MQQTLLKPGKVSALGQLWVERLDNFQQNQASFFAEKFSLSEALARILVSRNIDEEGVDAYLTPTLRQLLPDPLTFKDMKKAASYLAEAIIKQKKIAIWGDYDVDGACASAILYKFLAFFSVPAMIYIPDRLREGYGPNATGITQLVEQGAQLIVAVDCGSTSEEASLAAKNLGVDMIAIDHHQAAQISPSLKACVNPNRADDLSGYGYLCATAVLFITLIQVRHYLDKNGKKTPELLSYLDYVALATICDSMPLIGVNRAFVKQGVKIAQRLHSIGLTALARARSIDSPLNTYHLGYILGPCLNASGRIGNCHLASELLICNDTKRAEEIACHLVELNKQRQDLEQLYLLQAKTQIEEKFKNTAVPEVLVLAYKDWHQGLVGLLAGRLKELYNKITFVFSIGDDGNLVGSARSLAGYDLSKIIAAALKEGLIEKGGGHAMAAGMSLRLEKLEDFQQWLNDVVGKMALQGEKKILEIDSILTAPSATIALYNELERAGPYGMANPRPVIALMEHKLLYLREVGKGHLAFTLATHNGKKLKGIAFRAAQTVLGDFLETNRGNFINAAGHFEVSYHRQAAAPQLQLLDAACCG